MLHAAKNETSWGTIPIVPDVPLDVSTSAARRIKSNENAHDAGIVGLRKISGSALGYFGALTETS